MDQTLAEALTGATLTILDYRLLLILALLNAGALAYRAKYCPDRPEPVQGLISRSITYIGLAGFYMVLISLSDPAIPIPPDSVQAARLASRVAVSFVIVFSLISNLNVIKWHVRSKG